MNELTSLAQEHWNPGRESDHASRRVVSSTSAFGQGAQVNRVKITKQGFHPEDLTPAWDLTMKNRGFNTNFLGDVSLIDMRNVEASNMWIEAAKTRIRSCTL